MIPTFLTGTPGTYPVEVQSTDASPENDPQQLSVLSFNLAHGRGNGDHQIRESVETIKENLKKNAALLTRENPHLVALQEADGPCFWSGSMNHVELLASEAGIAAFIHGYHVETMGLQYGTAVLSSLPIKEGFQHTFQKSYPTPSKGFTCARVTWQGREFDFVSVHLDYANPLIRKKQIEEMIRVLQERKRPLIVVGDFNCRWESNSPVAIFAEKMNLQAWEPENEGLGTFRRTDHRIDWILISKDFEFVSHQNLTDVVSDHIVVKSVIEWRVQSGQIDKENKKNISRASITE